MAKVRCPSCNEALDVHPDDLGTTVDCPSCDFTFRAKRSRQDDEHHDEERPRRRRTRMAENRDDEKKTNRTVFWIVGIILVVLGLPCLGCLGFIIYTNTAKVGFNGTWTDHSVNAQEGTPIATASFPAIPVSQSFSDAAGNGFGELVGYDNIVQGNSITDAVVAIGYIDYPDRMANPLDQVYLPIRKQLEELYVDTPLGKASISNETRLTWTTYPTKEARYSSDDGDYVIRVMHINDRSVKNGTRLVVVVAGGYALKPADRDKFLQSVRIGKTK
jgi:hypothetical protein